MATATLTSWWAEAHSTREVGIYPAWRAQYFRRLARLAHAAW
ncbi:hypothetical protein HMPREF9080_00635 [Cardiobacterium valvarum F0432]|uniref:Uncharacterized protein n=1 Tax=Cardiobacterium valvarum F0432 TaxID=797473 RepID=G9ZD02_9GAMM|nr:hypothetical protein HMPREF9080_00635 [Cardiobacterium valvarum F0432]